VLPERSDQLRHGELGAGDKGSPTTSQPFGDQSIVLRSRFGQISPAKVLSVPVDQDVALACSLVDLERGDFGTGRRLHDHGLPKLAG